MTGFLVLFTFIAASLSTAAFLRNLSVFLRAPAAGDGGDRPLVSVLIPARNEAHQIRETLRSVLANQDVDLEVVVLDDDSDDGTADIVREVATADRRVRLLRGAPLADGWCGKQFACHQLARQARGDELLFLDADVRLAPNAIARTVGQRRRAGVDLLSGFPRQLVPSCGEAMLIPLVHVVLLTYLPFRLMRRNQMPNASAGCGQLFLTSRHAYERSGGHAAVKASLHDGITLPRAYRRAGCTTDVFDASDLADCRMYVGWAATVQGLLKNAHEGMARLPVILPATVLMSAGYVAPTVLALYLCFRPAGVASGVTAGIGAGISYVPRIVTAARFDRAWLAVPWFPLSVLLLVILQWVALARTWYGAPASWRGRAYPPVA
jgi:hypothetical protein